VFCGVCASWYHLTEADIKLDSDIDEAVTVAEKKKELTSKQRAFARAWASGLSLSDSYRESYDVKDSTSSESVHTLASRLASRVEVRHRYEAILRERDRQTALQAVDRKANVLNWLEGVYQGTDTSGVDATRVRAAELVGKASGMFNNTEVLVTDNRNSGNVAAEIEAILLAANESAVEDGDDSGIEKLH